MGQSSKEGKSKNQLETNDTDTGQARLYLELARVETRVAEEKEEVKTNRTALYRYKTLLGFY